jgi:acetyl-CoA acetyltransferase
MESYIIDGVRTPIGNYQGTLAAVRADDLGALVIKTITERHPEIPRKRMTT